MEPRFVQPCRRCRLPGLQVTSSNTHAPRSMRFTCGVRYEQKARRSSGRGGGSCYADSPPRGVRSPQRLPGLRAVDPPRCPRSCQHALLPGRSSRDPPCPPQGASQPPALGDARRRCAWGISDARVTSKTYKDVERRHRGGCRQDAVYGMTAETRRRGRPCPVSVGTWVVGGADVCHSAHAHK